MKWGTPMICKKCGQVLGDGTKVCPICRTVQDEKTVCHEIKHPNIEENVAQEEKILQSDIEKKENGRVVSVSLYEEEVEQTSTKQYWEGQYPYEPRSRVLAGLLQIFLGGFGIGRFYLGYNKIALGQVFTMPIFFIGSIWGLIDGILILCGQVTEDANGVPLE